MSVMHTGVHVTCCSTGLLMCTCFCVLHVDGLCHVDFVWEWGHKSKELPHCCLSTPHVFYSSSPMYSTCPPITMSIFPPTWPPMWIFLKVRNFVFFGSWGLQMLASWKVRNSEMQQSAENKISKNACSVQFEYDPHIVLLVRRAI